MTCLCHPSPFASRRGLLCAGLGLASLLAAPGQALAQAVAAPPANAIPPAEALRKVMDGNTRYVNNQRRNRDYSAGRAARARSQHPIVAVLGCADSRVSPELAFDMGPGEVFAVRVAGNFANTDGIASLEYAVRFLGVPLVMVLGHTACGAVDAALKVVGENAQLPGQLPALVESIRPAAQAALGRPDALNLAIAENVKRNVAKLRDSAPILSEAVAAGRVQVVGGVYTLATGRITLL